MKKILYSIVLLSVTSLSFSQDAIFKKNYTLNIPASEMIEVKLDPTNGVQLPFAGNDYPSIGKRVAFKLMPSQSSGQPILIVVQTEKPGKLFVDELKASALKEKGLTRKQALQNMLQTTDIHAARNRGIQTIYRALTPSGNQFKLMHIRVPGIKGSGDADNEAMIVATPKGNLQIFENSEIPGQESVIELVTSTE